MYSDSQLELACLNGPRKDDFLFIDGYNELYPLVLEYVSIITVILITMWIICGITGLCLNKHKTGGRFAGFMSGFLFGPIGVLVVMVTPYKPIYLIQTQKARRERYNHSREFGRTCSKTNSRK